jgi:hypothetical protein
MVLTVEEDQYANKKFGQLNILLDPRSACLRESYSSPFPRENRYLYDMISESKIAGNSYVLL